MGTAGSIHLLKKSIDSSFFVSNCEIIIDCDYSDIYKFHNKNNFDLTLVSSAKNYEIPYGTCVLADGKLELDDPIEKYMCLDKNGFVSEVNIPKRYPIDIVVHYINKNKNHKPLISFQRILVDITGLVKIIERQKKQ